MPQIVLLTGLPRSGKTLIKNLLSLNDDIQITEKELFFSGILMMKVSQIEAIIKII